MTVSDTNTYPENLSAKANRIHGQSWGVYANIPNSLSRRTSLENKGIRDLSHRTTDASLLDSMRGEANTTDASYRQVSNYWSVANESVGIIFSEILCAIPERPKKTSVQWSLLPAVTNNSDILVRLSTEAFTEVSFVSFPGEHPHNDLNAPDEPEWDERKNDRRCDLVDKEIEETITAVEKWELEELQSQMLAYRRKVVPLPIAEARQLHQHLLRKAAENRAD